MPIGANPIVAMACFTGYNQEDSIIVNKSAMERGMFRSTHYRTYKTDSKLNFKSGARAVFYKPETTVNFTDSMRNKLDGHGIINPGAIVENEYQVLVGRKLVDNFKPGNSYRDEDGEPYRPFT